MGSQFDVPGDVPESGKRSRMHGDFVKGLRCFNSKDFEGALMFFRAADGCAELDDAYQNRYTSFHGLSRVYMGDGNGVKLCRKAAVGETADADVYYNLAMAEHRLDFYESAMMALRRGLNIDPEHRGLLGLKRKLSLNGRASRAAGLMSDNFVKRLLKRLLGHSG
jgi:tetratricopeptide (TPR) repeat protein